MATIEKPLANSRVVNVLLAADDAAIIDKVKEYLPSQENVQFQIHIANTPSETLQLLTANKVQLVLLDLNITGGEELSLFKQIQDKKPDLPLIVFARTEQDTIGNAAVQQGAYDLLAKDKLTAKTFSRVINEFLTQKSDHIKDVRGGYRLDKVNVLLVEDNPVDAHIVEDCLMEEKAPAFKVTHVESLHDAIDKIKHNTYEVVLLDLSLPDSHSIATFVKLHSTAPTVATIILSGLDDESVALEAVRRGAQDYLVKSVIHGRMLSRVIRYSIERKESEREISLAKEMYGAIFENAAVSIIVTNTDGQIVSWNKSTEQLLRSSGEYLHLSALDTIFTKGEIEKINLDQAISNAEPLHAETQITRRDGVNMDVDLSVSILESADGKANGSILILKDITERKKYEALKDDFVATVSHELRTPLTMVREGVLQVYEGLLGRVETEQKMVLSLSLEAIDRLSRIINDLLDISKIEAGKGQLIREQMKMSEIVKKAIAQFEIKAKEKNIELKIECRTKEDTVYVDGDKIIQVLTNLISNALKFTEKGSIQVIVESNNDQFQVQVKDSG